MAHNKMLCAREDKRESCRERRLGRAVFLSNTSWLIGLHPPAEQNKELLSASGPKQEILSRITVIKEVIFVFSYPFFAGKCSDMNAVISTQEHDRAIGLNILY